MPRILSRLGFECSASYAGDWTSVVIRDHRLYQHKLLKINYTTYDIRRDQDVIHIETPQCNVMLLNSNFSAVGAHSLYLYSRVLGIYHANVSYIGILPDGTQRYDSFRLDVVWGQWYENLDFPRKEAFQLDRLRLCPVEAQDSLHFMDPEDILRGVHLIPQFSLGKVDTLPPKSRLATLQESEWKAYYVNRCVSP